MYNRGYFVWGLQAPGVAKARGSGVKASPEEGKGKDDILYNEPRIDGLSSALRTIKSLLFSACSSHFRLPLFTVKAD